MAILISDSHQGCFIAFENLIDAILHPARDLGDQLSLKDVQEEFDKYRIWAGNVGAAHSGKRYEISLDYRLREASFLGNQVLRLLETLKEKLEDAYSLVCGRRTPFEEYIEDSTGTKLTSSPSETYEEEEVEEEEEEEEEDEDAQSSSWDISSSSSSSGSKTYEAKQPALSSDPTPGLLAGLGQRPSKELPRVLASIKFVISCLYRIPIRKPAPFDRLKDERLLGWSCYQHFDVLYVRDKFPLLDSVVASRLGKMITRRRQLLYYRQAHLQNLHTSRGESKFLLSATSASNMPEKGAAITPPQVQVGNQVAISNPASSHFTLHSKATTFQPGLFHLPSTQETFDSADLYAPSTAGSKTTVTSSFAGKELQIEIPPRPTGDNGLALEWFECPYCLISMHISTERKWKKHVLGDLQPYICTHQNCDLGDQFFQGRDEWYEHESQRHRITWFCNTQTHPYFENRWLFIDHMRKDHGAMFDDGSFVKIEAMFQQPFRKAYGTCNLCMRECRNLKYHISRHLQQMALFALPRVGETAGSGQAEHRTVPSKYSAKYTCDGQYDSDHYWSRHATSEAHNDSEEQERYPHTLNLQEFGSVMSLRVVLQMQNSLSDFVRAVAFSPDGQTLASASNDKTVKLWDASTSVLLQTLEGHSNSVAFSPDSQTLASASNDKTVKLWDANTNILLQTLEGHSNIVNAVAFSPDGKLLASASGDETIKLWNTRSVSALATLASHSNIVNAVAFSSDGQTLASASNDKTVKLWDANTSVLLQTLEGHSDSVIAVAFSPDGQTLASTSNDRTIKLWDINIKVLLQTLEGHSDFVSAVAFSPDGKLLVSASGDKTMRLWNTKSGAALATLAGHSASVSAIAFSPDGQTLVSASEDKTIKLWDVKLGATSSAPPAQAITFSSYEEQAWRDMKYQVRDDITNKFSDAREGRSAESPLMPSPSCNIPFTRDPNFVERRAVLDHINRKCAVPGSWTALIGLGGVGKSQLAIEYAYRTRGRSPETWVFWINAGNAARFEQSFRDIAQSMGVPGRHNPQANIFRTVHDWLRDRRKGQWVIILDDVDDPSGPSFLLYALTFDRDGTLLNSSPGPLLLILQYLPKCENGSVLITTRSKGVARKLVKASDIIAIEPMDGASALALSEEMLGKQNDIDSITELATVLNFIPLALVQAATFISQKMPHYSVRQYLEDFRKDEHNKAALLNFVSTQPRRDPEATNSIIATWQKSFDHIHNTTPSATDLLSLMSFFDQHRIPKSLIRNSSPWAQQHQEAKIGDGRVDANTNDEHDEEVDDEHYDASSTSNVNNSFEDDISILQDYSFVSVNADGTTFEMYGLVQLAVQEWLKAHGQQSRWNQHFIDSLYMNFRVGVHGDLATCQPLFPHVKSAAAQKPEEQETLKIWASLLYNAAWYAHDMGNGSEAEDMSVEAMNVRINILGNDHPDTLSSMTMVGLAFKLCGRWDAAAKMFVQVIETRKRVLGTEHPDTLTSISNLASTYAKQGRWKEAEELKVQVVEARKKALGGDHQDTLGSKSSLAVYYRDRKLENEAEKLTVQIMETSKRMLGEEHPDTLTNKSKLASIYADQGRWKEVEELEVQVIQARKKVLGEEHPEILTDMDNLASVFNNQGKYEEAERMHREALVIKRKIFGKEHISTWKTINNLAEALNNQDRHEEATLIYQNNAGF